MTHRNSISNLVLERGLLENNLLNRKLDLLKSEKLWYIKFFFISLRYISNGAICIATYLNLNKTDQIMILATCLFVIGFIGDLIQVEDEKIISVDIVRMENELRSFNEAIETNQL